MPRVRCWQVDAFTDRPFGGNPAAVCLLEEDFADDWMQAVAAEMNLSETAFVRRQEQGYSLRWFTPQVEVSLCGHATLASAHALWTEQIHPADQPIRFQTRSGVLTCQRHEQWIEMDFPATPARAADAPGGLLAALGVESAVYIGKTQFDYVVVIEDAVLLEGLSPDFRRLKQVATRGVIVTSPSNDRRFDFVSRFFAPAVGIDEDPVTGSAHCCLASYWAEQLGTQTLSAYQASRRGGVLRLRAAGDRVILGGQAVTVVRGELAG